MYWGCGGSRGSIEFACSGSEDLSAEGGFEHNRAMEVEKINDGGLLIALGIAEPAICSTSRAPSDASLRKWVLSCDSWGVSYNLSEVQDT